MQTPTFRTVQSALIASVISACLTACGGGGSSSSTPLAPSSQQPVVNADTSSVTRVEASQTSANNMVLVANANVDAVAQAGTLPSAGPSAANQDRAQALSVQSDMAQPSTATTQPCAAIWGSASSASGTITTDYTYGATGNYSYTVTYNQCSYTSGGETWTYNGYYQGQSTSTGTGTYVIQTTYDMTYTGSGVYNENYTYKGSQTCTYTGSSYSCDYDVGNTSVSGISGVTVSGTKTTINRGTVKTKRADAANSLTVSYSNWVFDSATGKATGQATVEDSLGNKATIVGVANGSGGVTYTVTIVYQGATSTYTIQA